MSLLTDEEQDACMPSEEQLEAYLAEPDDAIAAGLNEKDKRLVAKFILCGRNIADASQTVTLKAVGEWLDERCESEEPAHAPYGGLRIACRGCMNELLREASEGKAPWAVEIDPRYGGKRRVMHLRARGYSGENCPQRQDARGGMMDKETDATIIRLKMQHQINVLVAGIGKACDAASATSIYSERQAMAEWLGESCKEEGHPRFCRRFQCDKCMDPMWREAAATGKVPWETD